MKKILLTLFTLLVFCGLTYAQAPQGLNYQSVIRDAEGRALSNETVSLRLSLRSGLSAETPFYEEIHTLQSNEFGLINLAIGSGKAMAGQFNEIPWSNGNIWLDVAIQRKGDADFIAAGSSQLLSVPYAFYADVAGGVKSGASAAQSNNNGMPDDHSASKLNPNKTGCDCQSGVSQVILLYNGPAAATAEFYRSPNNNFATFSGLQDGDIITVTAPAPANNFTNTLEVELSVPGGGTKTIVLPTNCNDDIIGKSFDEFSVMSRTDASNQGPTTCSVCDAENFWSLKGNAILSGCDRLGSLNYQDVILISDNKDRGVMTKDGDFGLGTLNPFGRLHVTGGSVIFNDTLGDIPQTGPGTRMMWIPSLAALRFGEVNGQQWDPLVVGKYSVAGGYNTGAAGRYSVAMGEGSIALGMTSLAMNSGEAIGDYSAAFGTGVAENDGSSVFGIETISNADNQTVIGQYNTNTPLGEAMFIVGNGTANVKRQNALEVYKDGQTVIYHQSSGEYDDEDAYGLTVNSPRQGINIRLTEREGRLANLTDRTQGNQPTNDDHFITFNGATGEPLGRIEGETGADARQKEYTNDADWELELIERDQDIDYQQQDIGIFSSELASTIAAATSVGIDLGNAIAQTTGSCACAANPFDACISAIICGVSTSDAVNLGIQVTQAALDVANASAALGIATTELGDMQNNLATALENKVTYRGVAYASGGADYAEYLSKANAAEKMYPGDVVGVDGGLISLDTRGATELRVISTNPVVLGNMPPEDQEGNFERVGFLGQVPTRVRGRVRPGDYILPSGLNDGTAIARNANDMEIEDFTRIIGRAWSAKHVEAPGMVNVAVGLNSNDVAIIAQKQQDELDFLRNEIRNIQASLNNPVARVAETGQAGAQVIEEGMTFDPTNVRMAFAILQAINEAEPTYFQSPEYAQYGPILERMLDPTSSEIFLSNFLVVIQAQGVRIVEPVNGSFADRNGIDISPDFLSYNPERIRELYNRSPNSTQNEGVRAMIENPEGQEQMIRDIKVAQAIARVLVAQ